MLECGLYGACTIAVRAQLRPPFQVSCQSPQKLTRSHNHTSQTCKVMLSFASDDQQALHHPQEQSRTSKAAAHPKHGSPSRHRQTPQERRADSAPTAAHTRATQCPARSRPPICDQINHAAQDSLQLRCLLQDSSGQRQITSSMSWVAVKVAFHMIHTDAGNTP
ncbi:hypothetical protein HDV57DRAFT_411570 [Trichoderma longibrachiatum]|uniref:Uncharacterized protein n=1 Tax=Trichoderma longibrachiatum ATCC 18648 TaxID=983965 RepID=A0A2T4C2M6_TRILO|nr:hypothetical protein M440DRAFT_1260943 [Trichoderma longibrachiatum ATCC 18648]